MVDWNALIFAIFQRLASAGASERPPRVGETGEPGVVIDEVVD